MRLRVVAVLLCALSLAAGVPIVAAARATDGRGITDRDGASPATVRSRLPDLVIQPPIWPGAASRVCGVGVAGAALIIGAPIESCVAESPDDRWLRFGSALGNAGAGPLRLVLRRPDTAQATMGATQRVRTRRGWRNVASDATARWAEDQDGHRHWHVDAVETYRLFPLAAPGSVGIGVKRGYCFFDGRRLDGHFPRAPGYPGVYGFYSCQGYRIDSDEAQALTRIVVGLSVGWSDEYPWNYAGQRIDLSAVADGDYLLCLTADPLGQIAETDETDNEAWSRISIATTTGPPYEVNVTELGSGRGACADQLPYPIPASASARAAALTMVADG